MKNRLSNIEEDVKQFVQNGCINEKDSRYEQFVNLVEKLAQATDIYGHSKELDSLKNLLYGTLKI